MLTSSSVAAVLWLELGSDACDSFSRLSGVLSDGADFLFTCELCFPPMLGVAVCGEVDAERGVSS